jgi:hypothetical protein
MAHKITTAVKKSHRLDVAFQDLLDAYRDVHPEIPENAVATVTVRYDNGDYVEPADRFEFVWKTEEVSEEVV